MSFYREVLADDGVSTKVHYDMDKKSVLNRLDHTFYLLEKERSRATSTPMAESAVSGFKARYPNAPDGSLASDSQYQLDREFLAGQLWGTMRNVLSSRKAELRRMADNIARKYLGKTKDGGFKAELLDLEKLLFCFVAVKYDSNLVGVDQKDGWLQEGVGRQGGDPQPPDIIRALVMEKFPGYKFQEIEQELFGRHPVTHLILIKNGAGSAEVFWEQMGIDAAYRLVESAWGFLMEAVYSLDELIQKAQTKSEKWGYMLPLASLVIPMVLGEYNNRDTVKTCLDIYNESVDSKNKEHETIAIIVGISVAIVGVTITVMTAGTGVSTMALLVATVLGTGAEAAAIAALAGQIEEAEMTNGLAELEALFGLEAFASVGPKSEDLVLAVVIAVVSLGMCGSEVRSAWRGSALIREIAPWPSRKSAIKSFTSDSSNLKHTKTTSKGKVRDVRSDAVGPNERLATRSKIPSDEVREAEIDQMLNQTIAKLEEGRFRRDDAGALVKDAIIHRYSSNVVASRNKVVQRIIEKKAKSLKLDDWEEEFYKNLEPFIENGKIRRQPGKTPKGETENLKPALQSMHFGHQAVMKSLGIDSSMMITRLEATGKGHLHTMFDKESDRLFRELGKETGSKMTTAEKYVELMRQAAHKVYSAGEAESVYRLVFDDVFRYAGLSPGQQIRMPIK